MSTRAELPIPGLLWGEHPERRPAPPAFGERCSAALRAAADRIGPWQRRRDRAFVARVRAAEAALAAGADPSLALQRVRQLLVRDGLQPATLAPCFALVSALAQQHLGRRPFDSQLVAARAVHRQPAGRDGHRRGQDAGRRGGRRRRRAGRHAGARGHRQRLPGGARRRNAAARCTPRSACASGCVVQADDAAQRARPMAATSPTSRAKELVFDYLRDGVGRRPAPRAGAVAGAPARTGPRTAAAARPVHGHRRRGRRHPDRRGARAADPVAARRHGRGERPRGTGAALRAHARQRGRLRPRRCQPDGAADRARRAAAGARGGVAGRRVGVSRLAQPPRTASMRWAWRWPPCTCCSATATTWCATARS